MTRPPLGLVVAAASSHSGKTVVTMGLAAALRRRGLAVAAAKCGPDYIDPRFLEAATGRSAINLDPWAMPPDTLARRASAQAEGVDVLLVEGVMGLFDGGAGGIGSTHSLAVALGLPVVLVVEARGLAQSAAAVAAGFAGLSGEAQIVGAIANGVGSERHADLVREGFMRASAPLLGCIRRDPRLAIASRHLGLVQAREHARLGALVDAAAEVVGAGVDLDALLALASPLPTPTPGGLPGSAKRLSPLGQRIAVASDEAFAFAYPHMLQDWRAVGAEIMPFSPLADEPPPAGADAVFLPGGYPELHAGRLTSASCFRDGIAEAAASGALVYGECGGYMALGYSLTDADGLAHPMLGLLPLETSFAERRLTLGYRSLTPLMGAPFPAALAAHEFHYATIAREGAAERLFAAATPDGASLGEIGLRRGRAMGSFAHVIDIAR